MAKILVADDEQKIREVIREYSNSTDTKLRKLQTA